MTHKQEQLYQVLKTIQDQGEATFSIHDYELYPVTPDSINPALVDLAALAANNLIGSFERLSSRRVKVTNITL
jgi:hypothetical protein